jgi:hypothetical protein
MVRRMKRIRTSTIKVFEFMAALRGNRMVKGLLYILRLAAAREHGERPKSTHYSGDVRLLVGRCRTVYDTSPPNIDLRFCRKSNNLFHVCRNK